MLRRWSALGIVTAGGVLAALAAVASLGGQAPGSFEATPDLVSARSFHRATLLDGGRVLLSGGFGADFLNNDSSEIYRPDDNAFVATNPLSIPRQGHSATRLLDGSVLIAGGSSQPFEPVASAERFDQLQDVYNPTGVLLGPRTIHTATLLPDGRVLVAGGLAGGAGSELASAELYEPADGTFSATGAMGAARAGHTATLMADGRVLVVGGAGPTGEPLGSEFYDPATGSFSAATPMIFPRSGHTTTALADGRVLIAGGQGENGEPLAAAEIFDPRTNAFHFTAAMQRVRQGHSATRLLDGTVLIVGGLDAPQLPAFAAELYDPLSGAFLPLGEVVVVRSFHTATLLPGRPGLHRRGDGRAGGGVERALHATPPPASGKWALVAGWNLVGWTGEPTPPGPAIAATAAITAVLTWDPVAQDFRAHRPQGPALLNTLDLLRTGDGVWAVRRRAGHLAAARHRPRAPGGSEHRIQPAQLDRAGRYGDRDGAGRIGRRADRGLHLRSAGAALPHVPAGGSRAAQHRDNAEPRRRCLGAGRRSGELGPAPPRASWADRRSEVEAGAERVLDEG